MGGMENDYIETVREEFMAWHACLLAGFYELPGEERNERDEEELNDMKEAWKFWEESGAVWEEYIVGDEDEDLWGKSEAAQEKYKAAKEEREAAERRLTLSLDDYPAVTKAYEAWKSTQSRLVEAVAKYEAVQEEYDAVRWELAAAKRRLVLGLDDFPNEAIKAQTEKRADTLRIQLIQLYKTLRFRNGQLDEAADLYIFWRDVVLDGLRYLGHNPDPSPFSF